MCLPLTPFGKPSGGWQPGCANNRRSAEQCLMSSWEVSRLKTLMKEDPVCPPALAAALAPGSSCQGSRDPALRSQMKRSLCSPDWPSQQPCPAMSVLLPLCHAALSLLCSLCLSTPASKHGQPRFLTSSHVCLHYSLSDLIQANGFKLRLYVVDFSLYNSVPELSPGLR